MNVDFRSTYDHAKWAVTVEDDAEGWTCFSDINRSVSLLSSLKVYSIFVSKQNITQKSWQNFQT